MANFDFFQKNIPNYSLYVNIAIKFNIQQVISF